MAKKKRKDEGEWEPPEFDEVEYMKTEMHAARAAIVAVLWAVPSALVSWGLTLGGIAIVAFFAGLGMLFLLKWVYPLVKVNTTQWKRRDWMGHGVTFFFSWLAFWILLLNPPFADLTNPSIASVAVNNRAVGCGGVLANVTLPLNLTVTAGDNVGVALVTAEFTAGTPLPMTQTSETAWKFNGWRPSASPASVTFQAKDVNGHLSAPCTIRVTFP